MSEQNTPATNGWELRTNYDICHHCSGTGKTTGKLGPVVCFSCDGKGFIPGTRYYVLCEQDGFKIGRVFVNDTQVHKFYEYYITHSEYIKWNDFMDALFDGRMKVQGIPIIYRKRHE